MEWKASRSCSFDVKEDNHFYDCDCRCGQATPWRSTGCGARTWGPTSASPATTSRPPSASGYTSTCSVGILSLESVNPEMSFQFPRAYSPVCQCWAAPRAAPSLWSALSRHIPNPSWSGASEVTQDTSIKGFHSSEVSSLIRLLGHFFQLF